MFSLPLPGAAEPGQDLSSDQLSAKVCLLAACGRKAWRSGECIDFPSLVPTALLVYRVFRNEAKRTIKVLHGLLHVFAFIIALVGEFLGTAFPSLFRRLLLGIPGRDTGCWDASPEVLASQVSLGSPRLRPSPISLSSCDPSSLVQAWWRCSTTTGRRAMLTCTACTAGVASSSLCSTSCR